MSFLIAIAKIINSESLNEEENKDLLKINSYETFHYSPKKEGYYLREYIQTILLKSIKFDLFMGELQNIQGRLNEGKEQLLLMENIVEIATKYLPEKTDD